MSQNCSKNSYDQNENDIEKKENDVELIQQLTNQRKDNKNVLIKTKSKTVKRKNPLIPPINNMVNLYTPQQFFDQPANITNRQLITIIPKFRLAILKAIQKLIAKKPKDPIIVKEKNEDIELNYASRSKKRTMALYYDVYIKNVKIPLIIGSSSVGCIICIKLLKDLDMKITEASKTIMVNVNDKKEDS
ncbi:14252_t:CDS:1 [Funneliformis geosporum]|uniref:14252_t:CDS:1 n=1 Tax=Funneliformis geosporum TaxID=1117311 RepID=A0A9W4X4T9_9GLOM|nr:14252_t:CDS:1 [Funneliformis geosporum]